LHVRDKQQSETGFEKQKITLRYLSVEILVNLITLMSQMFSYCIFNYVYDADAI